MMKKKRKKKTKMKRRMQCTRIPWRKSRMNIQQSCSCHMASTWSFWSRHVTKNYCLVKTSRDGNFQQPLIKKASTNPCHPILTHIQSNVFLLWGNEYCIYDERFFNWLLSVHKVIEKVTNFSILFFLTVCNWYNFMCAWWFTYSLSTFFFLFSFFNWNVALDII